MVQGKVSFGFATVNAGQRNTVSEPQFIAVSTEGGFRMTPPVSAFLNVQDGEYVQFINNIQNIDTAIAQEDPAIVAFCEEKGLELGSPEASVIIHKEMDMWLIAKGVEEFDSKGNHKTMAERLTKADRTAFVEKHFDEMVEAAKTADDEDIAALANDEDTPRDVMITALLPWVTPKELNKVSGSKVANPGSQTGAGVVLTFTDSNVWGQLKSDLGEDGTKVNRVFDVDVDNPIKVQINNGYKMVEVWALALGDYTDVAPAKSLKKASSQDAE